MATAATAIPPRETQKQLNNTYNRSLQAPPSPPMDDVSRCSLPSISSLLDIANGGPGQESNDRQLSQHHQLQQAMLQADQGQHGLEYPPPPPSYLQPNVSTPKGPLPPTPPMRPDSVDDSTQSPSAASSHSTLSQSNGYLGNVGRAEQPLQLQPRHHSFQDNNPYPMQVSQSPSLGSQYQSSPGASSSSPYYPISHSTPPPVAYYQQRPLPTTFPPPVLPVSMTATTHHPQMQDHSGQANPWQHHHYIAPSSSASFPQSQDRYICQTCQKAFSRPSSLRIHSHSHTGEKPFKCPHAGCGKAFSVRSNMKRHERGCHGGSGGSPGST
ncbi:MAG: hypothetical protein M1834_009288 [Cirrosporium novae-zelandiae]|nr:MAG: hypothetical protein M1834_009288 [Cirrosporium novae-zelandiae]